MAGRIVTVLIRLILLGLCRIHVEEVGVLPRRGPCLVVVNHVNFLEVPILYILLSARLEERRVWSLAKEETWRNPALRFLARVWHAIPVRRGRADGAVFRAAAEVFSRREVLVIAPEGTRTGDGVLRRGHGGAVTLAYRNSVPLYPVAHFGGHQLYQNLRRFRRTHFCIRAGTPVVIDLPQDTPLTGSLRREITREMMGRLAALLPEEFRGEYRAEAERSPRYLKPFRNG